MPPLAALLDLSGKTAIVTGGAVGIGYGISYRLAEAGAHVVIADRDGLVAEQSADTLRGKGWKASASRTDVAVETEVSALIASTVEQFGSVDILVNNAGIYPTASVLKLSLADFDRILSVNLKGVFLCTKAAATQMVKQGNGGRIINISSVDAVHPSMIGLAAYDASKHGVWGFTKNAALELAPHRIWINAIAPGAIRTPGTGAGTREADDTLRPFIEKIPMKRMGEPDEIGRVALFLASEASSYMTGSHIVVDGGVLLS